MDSHMDRFATLADTVTHREVYSVACPKCGVERRAPCLTPTGFQAAPHKPRIKAAEAAKAAGTLAVIATSREVSSVACPACGAERGTRCVTPEGLGLLRDHATRIEAAEAARADGNLLACP